MNIPRVAAIHDLSGLGKCSLTAALPVLAAMGVQACPLPTAVLSCQTGFARYESVDFTDRLNAFAESWTESGVGFDGVYTGFLTGAEQARIVCSIVDKLRRPGGLVLVDPVLGDGGARFSIFDDAMCAAMRELVRRADVITPNLTEACILTGADYSSAADDTARIWDIIECLRAMGPKTVIVTGVPETVHIANYAADRSGARACVRTRRIGAGYSGTGDLLASVVCGGLIQGRPLGQTLRLAADFLEAALEGTVQNGTPPAEGVAFESCLSLLLQN